MYVIEYRGGSQSYYSVPLSSNTIISDISTASGRRGEPFKVLLDITAAGLKGN
jgi:hypothetical protein